MTTGDSRKEVFWKLALGAVIAMAAGPEIFAALELQILLELLGAALFMTAFTAGARLALLDLGKLVLDLLVPPAHAAILRGDARHFERGLAAIHVLGRFAACACAVFVCVAWLQEIRLLP